MTNQTNRTPALKQMVSQYKDLFVQSKRGNIRYVFRQIFNLYGFLYAAIAIPCVLLFWIRDWSTAPFEDGEAFLFVAALIIGVLFDYGRTIRPALKTDPNANTKRAVMDTYAVLNILLLGATMYYLLQSSAAATSKASKPPGLDAFHVLWFALGLFFAYTLRTVNDYFPVDQTEVAMAADQVVQAGGNGTSSDTGISPV